MNTPMSAPERRPRVLVIDDDTGFRSALSALLATSYEVDTAASGAAGLAVLDRARPDVVLLDIDLNADIDGIDVLRDIQKRQDRPPVIMMTWTDRIDVVVEAIKAGAHDYLTKPPDLDLVHKTVRRALTEDALRRKLWALERDLAAFTGEFITRDPHMLAILQQVDQIAATEATVLVTGQSGTGKELVARRIHARSPRRDGPFVAVNCAALPKDLMESELFGHERGSYTGADRLRRGSFELAGGGTLFLDELGHAAAALQAKLLRVLEERTFKRVGGEADLVANVRVIAATSGDVDTLVRRGDLQEELYYRLNVFRVDLPPLRDRGDDVLVLAGEFARTFAAELGKHITSLTPAAANWVRQQDWPGNVRQLRNAIFRAVSLCQDGHDLDVADLFDGPLAGPPLVGVTYEEAKRAAMAQAKQAQDHLLLRFKRDYLAARLRETEGNVTRAAELSGLRRQSFQAMLKDVGIDAEAYRGPRN